MDKYKFLNIEYPVLTIHLCYVGNKNGCKLFCLLLNNHKSLFLHMHTSTEKHRVKVMTETVSFSRKCSENVSEKHNLKRNRLLCVLIYLTLKLGVGY